MTSPTQLSLRRLRAAGYLAQVVERWNAHARVRQDLFGILDIIAVGGDILGVQTTTASSMRARLAKLRGSPALPVLRTAGIRVVVHGWAKRRGRWQLREVVLS